MAEERRAEDSVWTSDEALWIFLFAGVLTFAERALVSLPLLRDLRGQDLIAMRVAGVALYYLALGSILARFAAARGRSMAEAFALDRPTGRRAVADAVLLALAAVGFYLAFASLLHLTGWNLGRERDIFGYFGTGPIGIFGLIALGVAFGPLVEEVVFRGALLPGLATRYGERAAIWLSALLFSAIHVEPVTFVPFVVLGALLGWLRVRYRSLLPCWLCHATFNGTVFVLTVYLHARF